HGLGQLAVRGRALGLVTVLRAHRQRGGDSRNDEESFEGSSSVHEPGYCHVEAEQAHVFSEAIGLGAQFIAGEISIVLTPHPGPLPVKGPLRGEGVTADALGGSTGRAALESALTRIPRTRET